MPSEPEMTAVSDTPVNAEEPNVEANVNVGGAGNVALVNPDLAGESGAGNAARNAGTLDCIGGNVESATTGALVVPNVSLPKDALKLPKFKGDSDLHAVPDFLFQLEVYFDALPSTFEVHPQALKHRLVVVVGCFPPGSVAAVWFRSLYKSGKFTSYETFCDLFIEQFQRHAADLVSLQTRWEDATQRRNQSAHEYYAFLLQMQAKIAAIDWQCRPSDATLLTKYCASLRPDLKRFLQEKRIDRPDFSIHQLVQSASVREAAIRAPSPSLNALDAGTGGAGERKWCFFCKSNTHTANDCRKIAKKKARGEWKERPRQENK